MKDKITHIKSELMKALPKTEKLRTQIDFNNLTSQQIADYSIILGFNQCLTQVKEVIDKICK